MSETTLKNYTVYRRSTGERLAKGTGKQCAATLRITYGAFLTMVCRSNKGKSCYRVEVEHDTSGSVQKMVDEWDRLVYLPAMERKALRSYPCSDCAHRSLCTAMDAGCALWHQWYVTVYDQTARRLELMGGGDSND